MLDLLREVDDEFFPPLHARADTLSLVPPAPDVAGAPGRDPLEAYVQALQDETWLLARDGEQVAGLLSYLPSHEEPALADHSPSHYVTTIAVARRRRGTGVAAGLYEALDAEARRTAVDWVSTRTWSTNTGHIRLLRSRGFLPVARRPRAGAVESVYFARPVTAPGSARCP